MNYSRPIDTINGITYERKARPDILRYLLRTILVQNHTSTSGKMLTAFVGRVRFMVDSHKGDAPWIRPYNGTSVASAAVFYNADIATPHKTPLISLKEISLMIIAENINPDKRLIAAIGRRRFTVETRIGPDKDWCIFYKGASISEAVAAYNGVN